MDQTLRSGLVVILVIIAVVGGIFLFDGFASNLPGYARITSWTATGHAEAYVIGRNAMGNGYVTAQVVRTR